jgi:hypothetical protein
MCCVRGRMYIIFSSIKSSYKREGIFLAKIWFPPDGVFSIGCPKIDVDLKH